MGLTLKKVKNNLIFALVALLAGLFQSLPLGVARAVGSFLGRVFFRIVPYERRKAIRTASIAFPELDERARLRMLSNGFAHIGRGGVEFLRFPRMSRADVEASFSRVEGWDAFAAAVARGKGMVMVTGHLGHWELLCALTAGRLPKVGVVAQKLYDPRFDEVLNEYRRQKGAQIFPRNTPVRPILRFLKDGGVLGVLADQDTNVDSVWVPFFGRLAKTPTGPAALAQASGASLATVFCWREPDGRYAVRFEAEIAMPPRGQDVTPVVAEYTRRTEAALRAHPEQWVWMHERWKSAPPEDKA